MQARWAVVAVWVAFVMTTSLAMAEDQEILPPDLDRVRAQERVIHQAYEEQFDEPFPRGTAALPALQRMLDERLFRPDETYKLQSMGIVLGQVLSELSELTWITVSDQYGTDPALRFKQTSIILFPMTMISKRVERSEVVDVEYLFEKSLSRIRELEIEAD